jgi:hypothetical protein
MIRVLTCLGMISVLLLTFTAAAGFVSNGYQKVYGAADFPTSDSGTQIREWINNQIRDELSPPSAAVGSITSVKITLSNFPHQIISSVTNVDLTCRIIVDQDRCSGDNITGISGLGHGIASVTTITFTEGNPTMKTIVHVRIQGLHGQTDDSVAHYQLEPGGSAFLFIDIPGIGVGLETVQLT